jgi:hypothetical protein
MSAAVLRPICPLIEAARSDSVNVDAFELSRFRSSEPTLSTVFRAAHLNFAFVPGGSTPAGSQAPSLNRSCDLGSKFV